MKSKFIKFEINIPERKEDYLTDNLVKMLMADRSDKSGIYKFGDVSVNTLEKDDTLVVCGKYIASTITECKAMVKILKEEIKRTFQVKKVVDLTVSWGDALF